jgi:hypothetical protein
MNAPKHTTEAQQQSRQERMNALLQEMKALQQEIAADEPAEDNAPFPKDYVQGLAEGTVMHDGSIFVGLLYSEGNRPVFAAPNDAPIPLNRADALTCAKALQVGDKKDFHVPNDAELALLFKKREAGGLKGTFNTEGNKGFIGFFTRPYALYGSSSTAPTVGFLPDPVEDRFKWAMDFSKEEFTPVTKGEKILYRFVR